MNRVVRQVLVWGVIASLLLPIAIMVVAGLGGLLGSLGDVGGSRGCTRVALVLAAIWLTGVIATAVMAGIAAIERPSRRRRRGRDRRPGRRRPRSRAVTGPEAGGGSGDAD
jgi:hypothetical protein